MTCRIRLSAAALLLGVLAGGGACRAAQQAAQPAAQPGAPAKAAPPASAQSKSQNAKPSPVEENPFPEEQSEAAQKQATAQDKQDRKAADAGSAVAPDSPDAGSSSRDKLAGMDILGDHESRISNGAGGTVVDPKLSLQDLKVGQQYMGMGNYQGAYERFKEACAVNPGNVEAVFYLAEAARKTGHLDESAENYRVYLQVQPDGGKAKAARKSLAQLQGK